MPGLAQLAALLLLVTPCLAQADEAPLPVQEIAPGIFVFAAPIALADAQNGGDIANLGFVVGSEAVAVIDSGGSLAEGRRLLAAIRARTSLPVRYVIDTHVHPDHVLGNGAFPDATIVGHANLPEALAARADAYLAANRSLIGTGFADTQIVLPRLLVSGRMSLDLGGRNLLLEAWLTAHSNTDLTVLDQATGTWFLGDLLFVDHVPALDGSLRGWITLLAELAGRSASRVVPGHGPASCPWPEAAGPIRRYLDRLALDVRTAIRQGRRIDQAAATAARSEAGSWRLFDDFNARNATAAYHELEWE